MEDLNNSQDINENLENINENSDNLSSINIETFKTSKICNQLKDAYKKFKSYTYYNQYSAIDRLKLSEFEFKNFCKSDKFEIDEERLDQFFEELAEKVISDNLDEFIDKVDVISLPKKMQSNKETDSNIFTNFSPDIFSVDKIHYFIDLPIEGHILGVLWILRCGYILDDKLYKNCYSNRINNKILNNLKNTQTDSSTFLFYPYFKNYESWRDNGLDEVTNILNKEQNAIMISLDLKDYYYTSRINFNNLKEDMENAKDKLENNKFNNFIPQDNWDDIDDILNCFVEHVFEAYHKKFSFNFSNNSVKEDSGYMIPLGFLPSLIIANWNLQGFDQAILENVHPNYYGRYADDILIVLPSHEKSDTHGNQFIEDSSLEDIVIKFLTPYNDPKNSILKKRDENNDGSYGIENLPICSLESEDKCYCYDFLEIQEDKFKVYLFNYKESQAMIKKFKKEIAINTSEFKLLHGVKSTFENLEYDLYRMDYEESINKLKDANNFRLNKFEASKILSRLIDSSKYSEDIDKKEITKEILSAFYNDALSYINLWEKIFSYLYINNEISSLKKLIDHIEFLIDKIQINSDYDFNKFFLKSNNSSDKNIEINNLKKSLNLFLYSSIVRVLSVKFEKNSTTILYESLNNLAYKTDNKYPSNSKNYDMLSEEFSNKISKLESKSIFTSMKFLFSSLQNNNLMRFPILDIHKILKEFLEAYIGLNDDSDEFMGYNLVKPDYDKDYGFFKGCFYPRYVKFYECILNQTNSEIFKKENNSEVNSSNLDESHINFNEKNFYDIKYVLDESYSNYNKINSKSNNSNNKDYVVEPFSSEDVKIGKNYEISILSEEKKDKVKVGLINTQLNYQDNINRIKNKPNLSYKRFDKIKNIINEAINKKVEFLVMPELYVPYEWIDKIVEVSRNHQMVIIFGLEYIVHEDLVKNYLMVSLPYTSCNGFKSSILTYRLKNHYAPSEINTIEDLNKKCKMNDLKNQNYILYNWKGISFVPYCCYEIADITARGLFKNRCHIVTISEFNKDTKYFENICESLSRDLYCYCISSNTSKYGGTSIIQPSSSEDKYIIRLKGGKNDYIVTHDLNISDLQDKSLRSYSADYSDTHFKPQPPGLKKEFK